MRRKIAAGNWKMNGLKASVDELNALKSLTLDTKCDIFICPPATLIEEMVSVSGESLIRIGGQDCHWSKSGAYTGEISAEMLANVGAQAVILGHSERRSLHQETSTIVHDKVIAAWAAGLTTIICVGETEADRDSGATLDVIAEQLGHSIPDAATADNSIIAYEPVWAIGTGRTPTFDEIADVHKFIRTHLNDRFKSANQMRILYGGSVNGSNAAEIFAIPNVDGGLVGGASLRAIDFAPIVVAASQLS